MAYEIESFDPSAANNGTFNTNLPVNGKFVVFNESNIGLTLTFDDGETEYAPAGIAMIFRQPTPNPNISWSQKNMLTGGTALSEVSIQCYQPNEPIIGVYPMNIEHQTFIGNSIPLNITSAEVLNTGNVAGTLIVSSQVSGDGGSAVSLTNDGVLVLGDAAHHGSISSDNAKFATDGSGNIAVGGIHATGNIVENNAISLQWKDSSGTARTVMQVDGGNNVQIFGVQGTDTVQVLDHIGNLKLTVDLINGILNIPGITQSVNASGTGSSGSMQTTEILAGGLKILILRYLNYKNVASAKSIALKNPFTGRAFIGTGVIQGTQLLLSGVAQSINVFTGLAAAGGASTSQTNITFISVGECGAFDTVADQGANSVARTGLLIAVGS